MRNEGGRAITQDMQAKVFEQMLSLMRTYIDRRLVVDYSSVEGSTYRLPYFVRHHHAGGATGGRGIKRWGV